MPVICQMYFKFWADEAVDAFSGEAAGTLEPSVELVLAVRLVDVEVRLVNIELAKLVLFFTLCPRVIPELKRNMISIERTIYFALNYLPPIFPLFHDRLFVICLK